MLLLPNPLPYSMLPKWETTGKDDFHCSGRWGDFWEASKVRHFVLAYYTWLSWLGDLPNGLEVCFPPNVAQPAQVPRFLRDIFLALKLAMKILTN